MENLTLLSSEFEDINFLIRELRDKYTTADNEHFLRKARYFSSRLPRRIQAFYRNLRLDYKHTGISVIKGYNIESVGMTPDSWDYSESYNPSLNIDFLAVLLCSAVGYVFGWTTQQKGKIIHDLIPQKSKGSAQTGYGSTSELVMHTEDSFHAHKAEFVCMYGIKNEGKVATTFASIRDIKLEQKDIEVLFNEGFELTPDESHLDKSQKSLSVTQQSEHRNAIVTTLYGNREYPYLCYDPAYTKLHNNDDYRSKVYNMLKREIDDKTRDIAIEPGDICIIDNRKVVHGRRAFTPQFTGNDRWLKRINITTNLRKSAGVRSNVEEKVVG
jgi:Fe(II)/alpha-ketoglutarate-dependent arginine beta-hydroxylase